MKYKRFHEIFSSMQLDHREGRLRLTYLCLNITTTIIFLPDLSCVDILIS